MSTINTANQHQTHPAPGERRWECRITDGTTKYEVRSACLDMLLISSYCGKISAVANRADNHG